MRRAKKRRVPLPLSKPKIAIQPPDFAVAEIAVRRLLSGGKYKTALDQAKDLHKALGTAASEELLLDAYMGRIHSLVAGGLSVEATALINLVCERYPAAKERVAALTADNLAASGKIDELLAPLNDPSLSPERLARIERAIQEHVSNPERIASCPVLPPEHPLRQAAAAVQQAFSAVTSGPVSDEVLALPEVSRRSPLAPWKMLIGAIAAMYRGDAESCRRYLGAIAPGSAPARLIPVIETLQGGETRSAPLTAAGREAVSRVKGDLEGLKRSARALEEELEGGYEDERAYAAMHDVVTACRRSAPALLPRLKQQIYICADSAGLSLKRVLAAIGGPPVRDADFQCRYARSLERAGETGAACVAWHVFRETATGEGWFRAKGPEPAAIYIHIAELLDEMAPWEMEEFKARLHQEAKSRQAVSDISHDPAIYFERASVLDPHPSVFSAWLEWAKRKPNRVADGVAERWRRVCPGDLEPRLFLISSYEKRSAFPTALRYLAEAERIESMHPEVRKARLRLTVANFCKQVQRKPVAAGAAKTLAEIAAMPQTQEGDHPAFLQALHYILARRNEENEAAQGYREEAERLLESKAGAALLIHTVAEACKYGRMERLAAVSQSEEASLPLILARVAALTSDFAMQAAVPGSWVTAAGRQFAKLRNELTIAQLRRLGECAVSHRAFAFAYAISAEGLTRGTGTEAEFLLLRARAVDYVSRKRAMACTAAAARLARQRNEPELAARAIDFLDEDFKESIHRFDDGQMERVLQTEKATTSFLGLSQGPDYSDLPGLRCDCPKCRRERGEAVSPYDGEEIPDGEDPVFDFGLPPGMKLPSGVPPELAQMMMEVAMDGMARNETPEETLERITREMGLDLPRPKRGKKWR